MQMHRYIDKNEGFSKMNNLFSEVSRKMSLHQKLYTGAPAQSADVSQMKVRKYTLNNKQLNFGPGTAPASHTTPL